MIKIDISGMSDGEYEFELSVPVNTLETAFDEFFGDIRLSVIVKKLGLRYTLTADAKVNARMECDRSLQIFEELISANFEIVYRANTKLFLEVGKHGENDKEIIIREDYKYIDISEEVLEHLALKLPMKRLAPEYRDKELSEIFPEIAKEIIPDENLPLDDRWSNLKNIKFN
ncbi:MAG: DUF177 domain-containing protein [Candidatus Kapabacteria bacterium]|nr:DUF177 domain-containing protein [Ignavibacteriota bacterium]MCW5885171.1 DUF177 domain-containing protein [Candidatus Kapabacteria bacterium]